MPFEAQSLEMPCEMKEKAFKTSREAFEGVLKDSAKHLGCFKGVPNAI